ncbi:MAG: diguanylate cyclase [Oscillospiraceae bacterium]|nr:diguanylate cyclase [Oscillospiraceae bacterium]
MSLTNGQKPNPEEITRFTRDILTALAGQGDLALFRVQPYPDIRVVCAGERLCRLLGYLDEEEFLCRTGGAAAACVNGEDLEAARRQLAAAAPEKSASFELRLLTKTGDVRWAHCICAPRAAHDGELAGMLVDMTQSRQAELALRARDGDYAVLARQCGRSVLRCYVQTGDVEVLYDGGSHYGWTLTIDNRAETALRAGIVADDSVKAFRRFYKAIRAGEPSGACDVRMRREDGEFRWYHADFTMVSDAAGAPAYAIVSSYDNTQQLERELAYSQWQKAVAAMMADSYLYVELNLTQLHVERAEGLDRLHLRADARDDYAALLKEGIDRYVLKKDRAHVREFLERDRLVRLFASGVSEDSLEFRAVVEERAPWFRVSVQMAKYPYADEIKSILVFENIDGMRGELERLARAASRDSLTNLLNRSAAQKQIGDALLSGGSDDLIALYIVDLDNFKLVNDRLGHQAGDRILQQTAGIISDAFRASDIVGRLGGDEFIVCMARGAAHGIAEKKAAALCDALQLAVGGSGGVMLSASVGVCLMMRSQATFDELYTRADRALYEAKKAGKSGYRIACDQTPARAPKAEDTMSSAVQLKALLQYMDAGVVLLEIGDVIRQIYVSPSYCRMMGCDYESYETPRLLGEVMIHPDDMEDFEDALRRGAKEREVVDCVLRNSLTGNKWYWRHVRAVPIPYEGSSNPVMICVITDITEIKRTEGRLRETSYRLARKNGELEELLAHREDSKQTDS